jgi:hypothetical protein
MKELLQNKAVKYAAIALVVAIVAVILYYIYRKMRTAIQEKKLIADVNSEILPSQLNYTDVQYQAFASKLYMAMKGIGTDEEAIYSVMQQMKSRSDLMRVIAVFGVKDDMTLNEWMSDELNASEIQKVNTLLASNGILYNF